MDLIETIIFVAILIGISIVLFVMLNKLHVFEKLDKFRKEERAWIEKRKKIFEQTMHDTKKEAHELWRDIKHS